MNSRKILLSAFASMAVITSFFIAPNTYAAAGEGTATVEVGTGGTNATDATYGAAGSSATLTVGTKSYLYLQLTVGASGILQNEDNVTIQVNPNLFPANGWSVNETLDQAQVDTVGEWYWEFTDNDANNPDPPFTMIDSAATATGLITIQADGSNVTAGDVITVVMVVNARYASTAADLVVKTDDTGADDLTAIGSPISVTVNAADAGASIVQQNATVGATGTTTVTLTSPFALDADDTIDITFPAYFNVSGVDAAVTGTFENGNDNITCADSGQVVTCTVGSATTATSGTIIMTGITSGYAGTTDITTFEIEDEGSASNDIATDSSVALTDIDAADAAATIVLSDPTVGATSTTTVTLTVPFALDADDTIDITFPSYIDVSSVASAVTGTFENGNDNITCADSGQVVTCTVGSATTATSGTIIMTGITGSIAGTTDISVFEVEDEGNASNNIAVDTSVALTDVVAASTSSSGAPTIIEIKACEDGLDNDGDGLKDLNDPGCSDIRDDDETDPSSVATTTTSGAKIYTLETSFKVNTASGSSNIPVTTSASQVILKKESSLGLTIPPSTKVTVTGDWNGEINPPKTEKVDQVIQSGLIRAVGTDKVASKSKIISLFSAGSTSAQLKFDQGLTMEVKVDLSDGEVVDVYSSSDGKTWKFEGEAVVKSGVLTFTTNHLTYFAVAETGEVQEAEKEVVEESKGVDEKEESDSDEISSLKRLLNSFKTRYLIKCKGSSSNPNGDICRWAIIDIVYAQLKTGEKKIEVELTNDQVSLTEKRLKWTEQRYSERCVEADTPHKSCKGLKGAIDRAKYFIEQK